MLRWSIQLSSSGISSNIVTLYQFRKSSPSFLCNCVRFYSGPRGSSSPPEPSKGDIVTIKAYYKAKSIDVQKMQGGRKVYGIARRHYDERSVIMTLDDVKEQHIAFFNYGSVVFFNIPEKEHESRLAEFKEFMSGVPEGGPHTEKYKCIIHEDFLFVFV
jgi:uncharacterized Rmd1/YagE family protein